MDAAAPSSMLDSEGRAVGISTDKVKVALDRAGIAYTIELLPWKRAYAAAHDRVDTCVCSTTRTPELLLGRIDLWAAALRVGSPALEQNGWAGQVVPVLVFNRLEVYLACHRAMPEEVITRLNGAFAALERDGTMRRIERAYDNWSVTQAGK